MADTYLSRGPANVTTLLTTTLENYRKEMQDNIFDEVPFIKWLKRKGKVSLDGGATIVEPLMYGQNDAATWMDGYDTVTLRPQEGFTQAQYQWKTLIVPVSVSDKEENVQNAGNNKHFDIVQKKIKQAEMTMTDKLNNQFISTSIGAKEMDSLYTVIDTSSTIGEINSTSYNWWQSDVNSGGSFAARGLSDFYTLHSALRVDGAKTDGIVTRPTEEGYYEAACRPYLRFTSEKDVDLGIGRLTYKGIPIIADNDATQGTFYFVDSRHLNFYVRDNRNMFLTDFVRPANGMAKSALLNMVCQLGTNNRRRQGALDSVTA